MMILPGISEAFALANGLEERLKPEPHLFIPYHDRHGKLTTHFRWRLYNKRADGQKYYQAPGSGYIPYFCHLPLECCKTVFLMEGEKKTLAVAEAGYQSIGLPGLSCYQKDADDIPQILPELYEAVQFAQPEEICFVGDADTVTNLEYTRSAAVLASVFQTLTVRLLQLPLGGPKGVDDLRGELDGEFPGWLTNAHASAFPIDPKQSFLVPALLLLEYAQGPISQLTGGERERHFERIVRMAATARTSRENPLVVERFCTVAQKTVKLTKDAFAKAVEAEIRFRKAEAGEGDPEVLEKIAYYEAIRPWPVERPLADIILEARENIRQFVITDPRNMLLTACWAAHTFPYKLSPYLPMLVFTGAEEDIGKSTYMKVVGRMCRRAYMLIATASIHRVVAVYKDATYLLDESKRLAENKDMISFINAGFDNISTHPVDSPILPRFDMDSGNLLEFDPRFPKMFAGIGTFLERDTISRSLVILMERYLLSESRTVKEYLLCTDDVTMPVYRAFLRYWTDEHNAIFGQTCRKVLHQFPEEFFSRRRLKFVPLLAVAEMGGPAFYEETMEAAKWKHNAPDSASPSLTHQLLCDVARCFYRQVLLLCMRISDPLTGQPSMVLQHPEVEYLFPTEKLIQLLFALPETSWLSYGDSKKILNANRLYELLGAYGLEPVRVRIDYKSYRGLSYKLFSEKYERVCRVGDPTLDSVAVELDRDNDKGSSGEIPSGTPPPPRPPPPDFTPSGSEIGGDIPVSKKSSVQNEKSAGTGGTQVISGCVSSTLVYHHPLKEITSSERDRPPEVVDNQQVTSCVPPVPALLPVSQELFSEPCFFTGLTGKWERPQDRLSETAVYFSALLTAPERWVAIDIETTASPKFGKNKKKPLKTKDALNPWIGQVRLVAVCDGDQTLQLDLFEQPLEKVDVLRTFSTCGWIAHNAIFDLLYLKVHFGIVPPAVFCTQVANAILTNGRLHHGVSDGETKEIKPEVGKDGKPAKKKQKAVTLNTLKRALFDTLGIDLPKELGGSNWGGPLSPEQREYSRQDVIHLPPMASHHVHKLRESGLETVAMLEMALLPVLVDMKYHGFAVDREKVAKREKLYAELTQEKAEFVRSLLGPGCPRLGDNRKSGGLLDWIQNLTGVRLRNMEYASLLAWEHPIGAALVDYKQHEKRLKVFQALLKHSARDGKIHATLNQMGAVTGRFSCREINLQQLERGPELYRDCMIASGPDRVLVCGDSEQVELRTGCIFATAATGLRVLMDIFLQGGDVHKHTAANMLKKPLEAVSKDDRQKAKPVNFGLLYGQSAEGLREYALDTYNVRLEPEEAVLFRERHFDFYQDLKQWHQWAWDEIQNGPPAESRTILGRRHLLPKGTSKWNMFQALVNTPATGSAADLIKWQMVELARVLPPDCYLVMSVHDELICDCPLDRAQEVKALMEQVMPATFGKLFDWIIPGPADVSIGTNWEAAKP
jgi:DNA polymerase-1